MRIVEIKGRDMTPAQFRAYRRIFTQMLFELEGNYFEVVAVPAPDPRHSGHKIRVCHMHNAAWYRKFAAQFENCRGRGRKRMIRPRTYIKKRDIKIALGRLIKGDFRGVHAERLVRFVDMYRSNRRTARRQYAGSTGYAYTDPDIPF